MSDVTSRACRNVLRMVSELHLRGYQLIRIAPGMSPSGTAWRCSVTSRSNTLASHGARLRRWEAAEHYTSASCTEYFGWPDMKHATPSQLAAAFIARCPAIVAASKGSDWAYAGWFVELLHLTYRDLLPIAYADWDLPRTSLETIGPNSDRAVRIPLPPGGERKTRVV